MNYPEEILPKVGFKLIVADLTGFFLLRVTQTNKVDELIDPNTGKPNLKHVCSPREKIIDFSSILLGRYRPEYITIVFTKEGGEKYFHYCKPDTEVDHPVFETDFIVVEGRGYWCAPIDKLNGREFPYKNLKDPNSDDEIFTCLVCHTPMLWNFWHFSLYWKTPNTMIKDYNDKASKKEIQKVAHAARTLLSEILTFETPHYEEIPIEYFQSN
jgi:hypothetical protein